MAKKSKAENKQSKEECSQSADVESANDAHHQSLLANDESPLSSKAGPALPPPQTQQVYDARTDGVFAAAAAHGGAPEASQLKLFNTSCAFEIFANSRVVEESKAAASSVRREEGRPEDMMVDVESWVLADREPIRFLGIDLQECDRGDIELGKLHISPLKKCPAGIAAYEAEQRKVDALEATFQQRRKSATVAAQMTETEKAAAAKEEEAASAAAAQKTLREEAAGAAMAAAGFCVCDLLKFPCNRLHSIKYDAKGVRVCFRMEILADGYSACHI